MKKYVFTVKILGAGNTPDEAWQDATESFSQDPGATPDQDEYQVEDEDI